MSRFCIFADDGDVSEFGGKGPVPQVRRGTGGTGRRYGGVPQPSRAPVL